jgi:hypothetical protein
MAALALFANPLFPRVLGTYLFFGPQYLFSFSYVVRPAAGGYAPLFQPATAAVVCALLWLAATISYGLVARRWPILRALLLGLPVVVVAVWLVHLGFSAFGYSVQLDSL